MMFSLHINRELQKGVGLDEVRESMSSGQPDALYTILFSDASEDQETEDAKMIYTQGIPIFGYRYRIPRDGNIAVHHRYFMNDVVLLPLGEKDANAIKQHQLLVCPTISKSIISVNTIDNLENYIQPKVPIRILIQGRTGKLVKNRFGMKQLRKAGLSYHLLFTLDPG